MARGFTNIQIIFIRIVTEYFKEFLSQTLYGITYRLEYERTSNQFSLL